MAGTAFVPANWTGYDSATSDTIASVSGFSFIINVANLSATWKSNVQTDGGDIRVTKSDGTTELAFDLIDWDNTTSPGSPTGWIRFLFTGASGTSVTVRVWAGHGSAVGYDDNDASGYGADNAYDSSWQAYYPLHDLNDRTVNARNGTGSGSIVVGAATGQVGACTDFNAANSDYITSTYASADVAHTWTFWCRADSVKQMWALGSDTLTNGFGIGCFDANGVLRVYLGDSGSRWIGTSGDVTTDWTHFAVVYDGSTGITSVRKNGAALSAGSNNSSTDLSGASELYIAKRPDDLWTPWDGLLDDIQVHSANRASDWTDTDFAQTNDNTGFWNGWSWTAQGGSSSAIGLIGFAGNRLIG